MDLSSNYDDGDSVCDDNDDESSAQSYSFDSVQTLFERSVCI